MGVPCIPKCPGAHRVRTRRVPHRPEVPGWLNHGQFLRRAPYAPRGNPIKRGRDLGIDLTRLYVNRGAIAVGNQRRQCCLRRGQR